MAHSGHFRTSSSRELLPPQASLLLIPLVVWAASSGHTLSGLLPHKGESTKASPLPAFRFLSVRHFCYSYQRRRECERTTEHQESLKQTCNLSPPVHGEGEQYVAGHAAEGRPTLARRNSPNSFGMNGGMPGLESAASAVFAEHQGLSFMGIRE